MGTGPLSGPLTEPLSFRNAGDDEVYAPGVAPSAEFLLMETNDRLLLENGDKIKLESSP